MTRIRTLACIGLALPALAAARTTAPTEPSPAGAVVAAAADSLWTLGRCIDYAQAHNIEVRQRALHVEQSTLDVSSARLGRLPDLNASAGYSASFGRVTSDDNTYKTQNLQSGSFDVSAGLPIFQGFKINRQIRGAKLDLEAAAQELARAREDIAVRVMSLYLEALFAKEMEEVAERQLALSTLQVRRSRGLVDAGKQPASALYESLSLEAADRLALTEARSSLRLALLDLSQALNRPDAAGFDIARPRLDSITLEALHRLGSPEAIYAVAAEERPHIRAERLRLESAEQAVRTARSALYPSLSLRGGFGTGVYSSMNQDFWPQFRHNSSEFVGLSLSVPIFNRLAGRHAVRSAQIAARSRALVLQEAEEALRKQIEQAWYNADTAYEKYRSAEAAVETARVAFAYEERRAEAGRSTVFDFNDAKTRLEKAESQRSQAKYEFVFRAKILDYYRGEPLRFE